MSKSYTYNEFTKKLKENGYNSINISDKDSDGNYLISMLDTKEKTENIRKAIISIDGTVLDDYGRIYIKVLNKSGKNVLHEIVGDSITDFKTSLKKSRFRADVK